MRSFKTVDKFPVMIHFFGPDGSGKSTHVKILLEVFAKNNVKARKCWVRSPHTLAFILWRFFVKVGFCRTVYNPLGAPFKFPAVDRNKLFRLFWGLIEFFSILPLVIKLRIWMFKGYKLIAERYILDSVVTIAYFINDIGFLKSRLARLFFYFIPKNTVFIFLDSDYQTIFHRRASLLDVTDGNPRRREYGVVPKSAVEPKEFIDFQRKAYKVLSRYFGAIEINTSFFSVEETSSVILKHLHID